MPTPTPENDNATASRTDKAVVCDALVLPPKIGFFRHLVRGCGTLPHCGEHPGTMWLVMFALMGAMAGAKGGLVGVLGGAGIMLAVFGSAYLVGAYDRSKTDERIDRQNASSDRIPGHTEDAP